jgi:hypothetical protein
VIIKPRQKESKDFGPAARKKHGKKRIRAA